MANNELAAKLARRNQQIENAEEGVDMDLPTDKIEDVNRNIETSEVSDDLAAKLQRRNEFIDGNTDADAPMMPSMQVFNPYTEFKEFTRPQIKHYQKMFNQYDEGKDKFIDFEELKKMMEKLGAPQTHLALKAMIKEVDEDHDSKISFREFLLIFRKAAAGELAADSGLMALYAGVEEIDVAAEGVKGAKDFFQSKIEKQTQANKFEAEIKAEQEEKRRLEEERAANRAAFKEKANFFKNVNN